MLTLPQTAEYALRAVYFIAEAPQESPINVAAIAGGLRVPRNYLSKTLHQLVRAGILQSTRGPAGGFRLARPANRITLGEVVRPFMPSEGRACVLGRGMCSDVAPCAAHYRWRAAAERMRSFFGETTIADLVAGAENPAARQTA